MKREKEKKTKEEEKETGVKYGQDGFYQLAVLCVRNALSTNQGNFK